MTLWWIGRRAAARGRCRWSSTCCAAYSTRRSSIVPSVDQIADAAQAGSKDLDAVAAPAHDAGAGQTTIESVADYGGSLDVIVDDA